MTDLDTTTSNFFDYACDETGEPFCERISIMNLALGNTEDAYSLDVLAAEYNKTPKDMAAFCWGYVKARDCFKKPWLKFDASQCPKLKTNDCFCQFSEND